MFKKQGASEEALKKQFEDLEPVDIPDAAQYLISIYTDLSMARQTDGMGNAQPISYTEMQSYCALTGTQLDYLEVDALRIMDYAALVERQKLGEQECNSET